MIPHDRDIEIAYDVLCHQHCADVGGGDRLAPPVLKVGEMPSPGKSTQLAVQYCMANPEDLHTSNITQTEQDIYMCVCACACTCVCVCVCVTTINDKGHEFERARRYMGEDLRGKGRKK